MLLQSFIIPIIKVTDSCNFNCSYCYYAQNQLSSKLMTTDNCKKIIKECFDYNIRNHNTRMLVIFHGGEPLLQPIEFYEEMIEYEKSLSKGYPEFVFFNSIQTNGYLINETWADFFSTANFDIGVSIDGNEKYNQHYGAKGVQESTARVLQNLKILEQKKVPYGVISVITNQHTKNPQELYDFCKANDIHNLSLNYCYNPESGDSVLNENLIPFVEELFNLYFNGDYELNVREFNEVIAKKMGYCTDTCATCDRNNCGQYLSFDTNGDIFFCDTGYDKSTSIGNIFSSSLYQIIDSSNYLKKLYDCRNVYDTYCKTCEVVSLCGGGCHRYDNKKGETYVENYFCPTHKALCKHISDHIDCMISK